MTAGWCSRALRAATFAAVCVIFSALGHVMMSDHLLPSWLLLCAGVGVAGAAWCLAGREHRRLEVAAFAMATQAGLHGLFMLAQMAAMPSSVHGVRGEGASMYPGGAGHAVQGVGLSGHGADTAPGSVAHSVDASFVPGGIGMFAVHLVAAVLSGLWLGLGERAVFRVLRALAGWLAAPLRLLRRPPVPPYRPCALARRTRSERVPWRLSAPRELASRGPPTDRAAVAVVV